MLKLLCESVQPGCQIPFYSSKLVQQSSVALIFRANAIPNQAILSECLAYKSSRSIQQWPCNPQVLQQITSPLQLLFIQRAYSEKDQNSGQIAFPGGKCDDSESDFHASIRETQEEVGLNLWQLDALYLGRLPKNMKMRVQKDQRWLMVAAHIFLIFDPSQSTDSLNVQHSEVNDYRWIDLEYLAQHRLEQVISYKMKDEHLRKYIDFIFNGYPELQSLALQYTPQGVIQMIQLGMKNTLYGLTLNILQLAFMQITQHPNYVPPDYNVIANQLLWFKVHFTGNSYLESKLESLCNDIIATARYKNITDAEKHQLSIRVKELSAYGRPNPNL